MTKTSKRGSLAEIWAEFELTCVPMAAGIAQREDLKTVFYAGASAMFGLQLRGLDNGPEATEADMDFIGSLHQEIKDFSASLRSDQQ